MNAAARLVEVRVPDMGNFKDVAIIDVLVKPGDKIEPEAPLVTLETEKATMDVPSTVGGVVEKIHISKGGTVSTGDLLVTVRSEEASAAAEGQEATGAGSSSGAGGPSGAGAQGESPGQGAGASAAGRGATSGSGGTSAGGGVAAARAGAAPSGSAGGGGAGAAGSSGASAGGAGAGSPAGAGASSGDASGAGGPAGGPSTDDTGGNGGLAWNAATAGKGAPGSAAGSAATSAAGGARQAPSGGAGGNGSTGAAGGGTQNGAQVASLRTDLPPINEPGFSRAHAGPSVRRFARELGVDLTQVKGGGFKGRVTHEDVKAFVKKFIAGGGGAAPSAVPAAAKSAPAGGGGSLPAVPAVDFSQFGPVETKPLSRIQKISGPRLHASWVNIPHVTQFDEADITDLEDLRGKLKQKAQQANIKLTPLAFILRACVKALQQFPLFNTSLDATGANLVLKKYIHIGFAADTPNGLVVPVVRDADRKDVYEIARQLGELSEKARAGKLTAAEMQGGSFTISSLGGIGGTAFTPIINAPEVAILGVSRSTMRPVFQDGSFVPRLILPLSLSYDHRVIDGASAARFTTYLAETLADSRGLMEAVP